MLTAGQISGGEPALRETPPVCWYCPSLEDPRFGRVWRGFSRGTSGGPGAAGARRHRGGQTWSGAGLKSSGSSVWLRRTMQPKGSLRSCPAAEPGGLVSTPYPLQIHNGSATSPWSEILLFQQPINQVQNVSKTVKPLGPFNINNNNKHNCPVWFGSLQ